MKYISKRHLIVLVILVVVLGAMLLLGEKLSSRNFFFRETSLPIEPVSTSQQGFLRSTTQPKPSLQEQQEQIENNSFIIRPGQSALSYTDALGLYKKDILQFNENCQVASSYRNFGLNNEVMIDNRSPRAAIVNIGENFIVLGPYDFGFIILKEPGQNISVNCGDRKNVTTISVQ